MCQGFNTNPHEADESEYSPNAWLRKWKYCRKCDSGYRASRKVGVAAIPEAGARRRAVVAPPPIVQFSNTPPEAKEHDYVPDPTLMAVWGVVTNLTMNAGADPANFLFLGPAGSGKTEGAKFLASQAGLPFTKVDAASMTDPEAWFGTREIIVQEGVSVTKYVPSSFVEALQKEGVLFIDEMNRVDDEHRNVLLPILDATGTVINPLTGEIIARHKHCFIIMAGNRGLQFTGTSNIDPAFMTRALTFNFDYISIEDEKRIAMQATGCDLDTAHVFARFAEDTRTKAKADEDFAPISTREVLVACRLVAGGLSRDIAAQVAILNAASSEGGAESHRQELQNIWQGVRLSVASGSGSPDAAQSSSDWKCPTHEQVKRVPAGTSAAGKPYSAFNACPVFQCPHTEDKDRAAGLWPLPTQAPNTAVGKTCSECGTVNASGRTTFCSGCGATL